MAKVKYEVFKNNADHKLGLLKFVFNYPAVYFLLLFLISFFVILLSPHTVVFDEPESSLHSKGVDLSDLGFELEISKPVNLNEHLLGQHLDKQQKHNFANKPLKLVDTGSQCGGFKDSERFDCFPEETATEDGCKSRGCCWAPINSSAKSEVNVPYCYYPLSYGNFKYVNISTTDYGATAFLQNLRNSSYPDNVQVVKIDFNYLTNDILQIKIYDANNHRYESPLPKISLTRQYSAKNSSYTVNIDKEKIGFDVIRKSNNQSIFNAKNVGGFIFADQFLQLSAYLPSHNIYGLGQQRNEFQLDLNWRRVTLFNHDVEPADKKNLYGSHPFYLAIEDGGLSNGVFLHNSNAMDIILQPAPAITFRTIGGVLDLYFFLGPSPADVIRQYTEAVGRPFLPPFWSLGFHLCRFGYDTLNETIKVWNRTRAAGIPLDTQWNDIDYMAHRNDFTYDKVAFKGLPQFVDQLHKEGMHYVVILDPGVSAGETPGTYPPYDEGLKEGVFILDPEKNTPFLTKVWNDKGTVLPDFFNPKTLPYWSKQIKQLHHTFAFDGIWIDMNDPSTEWNGGKYGCAPNKLDNPPYLPNVDGNQLFHRTVCMSARHYNNTHYNLHNIYASQEAILTNQILTDIRKKRPFIISRSSYPGQGHFSGVWSGDITSTWDDMAHSISDVLSFSLFGIPLSGADICGFNGNTTVELCKRWSQLGAFYPFSRNHNSIENLDQDPVALGPEVVEAAKRALMVRYALLPYLYTLFWHAHKQGDTVARPMFVQFPKDDKTYNLHSQFMWGSALLIAPLLSEEKAYATPYLPKGRWYDFYLYKPIDSQGGPFLLTRTDSTPLLLHGGNIVPIQKPNVTTTLSRKNPMALMVCLCPCGKASGDLYWDDGDSLDYEDGVYNFVTFAAVNNTLSSTVQQWKYPTMPSLDEVLVLGVEQKVTKVFVGGNMVNFTYSANLKILDVQEIHVNLSQPFTLSWS